MFLKYGICIAVLVLLVIRFDKVFSWFSQIWNVAFPLILGCLVAYVLNIIMKVLENHWFPDTNSRVALRARRGVCVFLSIFLVFGVIFLIIRIVLPELVQAFSVMADEIPVYFEKIQDWIVDNGDLFPSLAERIGAMEINWQEMFNKIFTYVTSGFSSMLNSAFSFISHILSSVVNIAIATIFAVYILMNKEKLQSQVKTLQKVYMKKSHMKTVNHIIYTANECFTKFYNRTVCGSSYFGYFMYCRYVDPAFSICADGWDFYRSYGVNSYGRRLYRGGCRGFYDFYRVSDSVVSFSCVYSYSSAARR